MVINISSLGILAGILIVTFGAVRTGVVEVFTVWESMDFELVSGRAIYEAAEHSEENIKLRELCKECARLRELDLRRWAQD
jgi:hypothetical protein